MSTPRRRRTRTLSVLTVGLTATALAACSSGGGAVSPASGGSGAAALPKTLVFSPLSLAPPALKGLSEGVKGYAGSKGWQVTVQDPNFNAQKQIQDLTTVINSGQAGAVWTLAIAPSAMGDLLKAAQAKGVPVLVNGKPEEYALSGPQAGITFDYVDYALSGTNIGEQLGKCLTEKAGGNGKVLFATNAAGQAGKKEMEDAAKAALAAAAPNAKIVSEQIVTDRTKGVTTISSVLQGNPDINGVMAVNDEGALAALTAFSTAGKKPPCISELGGNDEVLSNVKSGMIYASTALQFQADMAQSFDTLVKMQSDPKAVGQVLTVPQKVITAAG